MKEINWSHRVTKKERIIGCLKRGSLVEVEAAIDKATKTTNNYTLDTCISNTLARSGWTAKEYKQAGGRWNWLESLLYDEQFTEYIKNHLKKVS